MQKRQRIRSGMKTIVSYIVSKICMGFPTFCPTLDPSGGPKCQESAR